MDDGWYLGELKGDKIVEITVEMNADNSEECSDARWLGKVETAKL